MRAGAREVKAAGVTRKARRADFPVRSNVRQREASGRNNIA